MTIKTSFALLFLGCALASAQEATLRVIASYRVKPDRTGDFEAEAKEYNAVLKKAGATHSFLIWSSASGPNVVARVDDYKKFADMDLTPARDPKLKDYAADLARINSRIVDCFAEWDRVVYRMRPDLSLPPAKEIPKMVRVLKTQILPDKVAEYIALKKENLAALKSENPRGYWVARAAFGASAWEFITVEGFDTWADLDRPPAPAPDTNVNKMQLTQSVRQWDVYRFRPELSYIAETEH